MEVHDCPDLLGQQAAEKAGQKSAAGAQEAAGEGSPGLTEEKSGDGTLEPEQVADDCAASAWSNGRGIHCCDVGKAALLLCINGVPHQARSPKQRVLCPAPSPGPFHTSQTHVG